jgi:hypothetical protein
MRCVRFMVSCEVEKEGAQLSSIVVDIKCMLIIALHLSITVQPASFKSIAFSTPPWLIDL